MSGDERVSRPKSRGALALAGREDTFLVAEQRRDVRLVDRDQNSD
jgi:hypothetical protein